MSALSDIFDVRLIHYKYTSLSFCPLFLYEALWSNGYIFTIGHLYELMLLIARWSGLFSGLKCIWCKQSLALVSKPTESKLSSGIQSGWIANYVSNLTLYCSWSTSCGEKAMNMQFLITTTGIVYGKRFCRIRNWTSTTIPSLINNLHSTRLTDWKDSMPQILTSCSLAVCFSKEFLIV